MTAPATTALRGISPLGVPYRAAPWALPRVQAEQVSQLLTAACSCPLAWVAQLLTGLHSRTIAWVDMLTPAYGACYVEVLLIRWDEASKLMPNILRILLIALLLLAYLYTALISICKVKLVGRMRLK